MKKFPQTEEPGDDDEQAKGRPTSQLFRQSKQNHLVPFSQPHFCPFLHCNWINSRTQERLQTFFNLAISALLMVCLCLPFWAKKMYIVFISGFVYTEDQ